MLKKSLLFIGIAVLTLTVAAQAKAQEFYIGEPVIMNELQIVPNYLTGIEMNRMPAGTSMRTGAVHLEVDVHAAADEKHGFAEDSWIPYLTVRYKLEKLHSKWRAAGQLLPMTAGDGPHYANNIDFDGPGEYHLTYKISPPSVNGFMHHTDAKTGVPDWWKPFSVEWTFTYPGKAK